MRNIGPLNLYMNAVMLVLEGVGYFCYCRLV
jgi:hypothetical protein